MLVNASMTIYNKYFLAGVEKYQRTQIVDVKWENTKAVMGTSSGKLASNVATIYVPLQRGANHLDPKAWQALVTKTGKWTLCEGDVIVKGLVSDEIGTGFTTSQLFAKYDNVLTISSVDTMDAGSLSLQHWQIGAK
jgi:hypothetical protein